MRAEQEVKNTQNSLIAARRSVIETIKNEYTAAVADERNAAGSLEQAKASQQELDRKSVDYNQLTREADTTRTLYTTLQTQQKELQVLANGRENNVQIMDRAEVPQVPYAPNPRKEWISAVMAGLVVAFGLAFGIEYLDDTVKTPEDITRRLKIPLLGLVPAIRGDRVPVLTETVPHDFGEAFRSLRTSLVFTSGSEHTRVVAVTSSQPLEGKTTTAANLALALALGGSRVLLIDADMRRPGLHKTLGMQNNTGLSHLLIGQARVRDAIQKTAEPNLLVITAGRTPPNPSELLASERMNSFLVNLQQGPFDWVIVDTPPVLAVTDAVILAPKVSGVVFVIGSEMTRRVHAERALETLRASRPRGLTAVLNRVDFDRNKYLLLAVLRISVQELLRAKPGAGRRVRVPQPHSAPAPSSSCLPGRRSRFAGRDISLLAVPGLVCIALAGTLRPWDYVGQPALDRCLVALVGVVTIQLIPLPAFLVDLISPADRPVWRQLMLVMPSRVPLTIDVKRTAGALLIVAASVLIFLVARRLFSFGGVRIVARGVALVGALLSAIALAQNATARGLVYWRWKLISEGPPPFGPFVNRNHFATWVVMAVPLCVGYLAAHLAAHETRDVERRCAPPLAAVRRADGRLERVRLSDAGRADCHALAIGHDGHGRGGAGRVGAASAGGRPREPGRCGGSWRPLQRRRR